jgi:hypothetical protein
MTLGMRAGSTASSPFDILVRGGAPHDELPWRCRAQVVED